MQQLWVPPISFSGTPIHPLQGAPSKISELSCSIQSAEVLRSPYQSVPSPNNLVYLYDWTLPNPSCLEQLANVAAGSFQYTNLTIGLLFSRPISQCEYVCRVPVYLSRGLARARVRQVGTQRLSSEQLNMITSGHHVLCHLLLELISRSLESVNEDDKTRDRPLDNFLFEPAQSLFLCLFVFLRKRGEKVDVYLEATQDLLLWSKSRDNCLKNERNSSKVLSPAHGVIPLYRCGLQLVDPHCRAGLIVKSRLCGAHDVGLFVTVSDSTTNPHSVQCCRLSRHLTSCRVNSGLLPDGKTRGVQQPMLLSVSECMVHPLSAWLWFTLSLLPTVLHQLNRALLTIEFHNELELLFPSNSKCNHPLTVLIPDRLDAPAGMLRRNHLPTEIDRQMHLLDVHAHTDLQLASTISRRTSRIPAPVELLEATTLLGADEAVNLERLEFLGDSLLQLVATLHVFDRLPSETDEGGLTSARSQFVCNWNLFVHAVRRHWYRYCTSQPYDVQNHFLPPCYVPVPRDAGHRARLQHTEKSLADMVEALFGCFLRYCDMNAACDLLHALLRLDNPFQSSAWCAIRYDGSNLFQAFAKLDLGGLAAVRTDNQKVTSCMERLGYEFKDCSLLRKALTHSSAPGCTSSDSYERLEFLGDAVLGYTVSTYIFENNPDYDPGQLTKHRSALVNNHVLAYALVSRQLHPYILHSLPSVFEVIQRIEAVHKDDLNSLDKIINCLEKCCTGLPVKIIGDVFESVVGAVFVDSRGDLGLCARLVYRLLGTLLGLAVS